MRHSWRVISTVEVLPLVPVTATTVSGIRPVEARCELGEQPARIVVGEMRNGRNRRLGPRNHGRGAAIDRIADKVLAVEDACP